MMAIIVTTRSSTRSSTRTSVSKANPNRIKEHFLGIHVLLVHPMHVLECHLRLFVSQHLLDDLHRDFLRAEERSEAVAQVVPPKPHAFIGLDEASSHSRWLQILLTAG